MSCSRAALGAVTLAALVTLTGCGGSSSPLRAGAPSTSAAAPSMSSAPSAPDASPSSGAYTTTVFTPSFTVRLPPGWTVAERDQGAAQLYKQCDTCVHGGEENGEITLDMALQKQSVEAAVARLRKVQNAVAGPVTPARFGELSGLGFRATRTGKGDVVFVDSGYHTDPTGAPLQVYAVRTSGPTITVLLESPRSGAATAAFRTTALAVLGRMHFSG